MSWIPTFSALGSAWAFLLVPPLVAFYFLKLRRPLVSVPSTALWARVLDDQRVNSPFQRFKRHLLLLLQLLLLIALITAAMQPVWRADGDDGRARLPVLIDCSASMAARDVPGGKTRMEAAREAVRDLIDNLPPDQELCLIAFASRARQLCGFTSNKRALRGALAKLEVADIAGDAEDAIRVAGALARSGGVDEVLIVSDGNLPPQVKTDLSFTPRYKLVGHQSEIGDNIGIVAASARRTREGGWAVLVEVVGSNPERAAGKLRATDQAGAELGSQQIVLDDDGSQRLLIELPPTPDDPVERVILTLAPDRYDALASDDRAVIELPRGRPLTAHVGPKLHSFRHALRALAPSPEELLIYPDGDDAGPASVDLLVTDEADELARPALLTISNGLIPEALAKLVERHKEPGEIVDWDRGMELFQHVRLADVLLTEDIRWADDADESALEQRGYRVAIHGRAGPLALQTSGAREQLLLLFDSNRSTLPFRVAFPVLVANALLRARSLAGLADARALRAGVLPPQPGEIGARYRWSGPEGVAAQAVSADPLGRVRGLLAPRAGRYQLEREGGTARTLEVAVLDAQETRLTRVEELQFREVGAIGADQQLKADRALWPWLALLGVLLLCGEWWIFNIGPRLGR